MLLKDFLGCIRKCDQIELHIRTVSFIDQVSVIQEDEFYKDFLNYEVSLIRSYHTIGISDYYFVILED